MATLPFGSGHHNDEITSPAPYGPHDLDPVVRLEVVVGEFAARQDLAIDLHRQALAAQSQFLDELRRRVICIRV